MDEQYIFLDKLCDSVTPIYFYFEILEKVENTNDLKEKIKYLELLQELKKTCKLQLETTRTLLHTGF